MFPNFPNFGKLPTYNFVIELIAPMSRLHEFAKDVLESGYVDLNIRKPEERKLSAGEQRSWRMLHWGTAELPKVKEMRFMNNKLIVSAECLISFPEHALRDILKKYEVVADRGICLAGDESEAFVIGHDEEEPLKALHLTRMQMRQYGILKML